MAATDANLGLVWGGTAGVAPFLHFMMSDYFSPTINDARNNAATVLSVIPQNTKFLGGKFIVERVKFGRNPRQFNAVGEDGRFPDPGQRKMRVYAYRSRQQFARFIIQGKLMRAATRDQAVDIDPVMDDLDAFLDDYLVDKARQMYSDGSGRLCEIAEIGAAATSQTFTMRINQDAGTGLSAPGASVTGAVDQPPTMYLEQGMRVLIVSALGVAKCVATVTTVDNSTEATLAFVTAVVSGTQFSDCNTVGVAVGDWVVKTGTSTADSSTFLTNARALADSAFKNEPMGLPGILGYLGPNDGTGPASEVASDPASALEGSSANYTAYSWSGTDAPLIANSGYFQGLPANSSSIGWDSEMSFNQGVVLHNSGTRRAPADSMMMRALDTLETANNARVGLWLSNHAIQTTYAESLAGEKRYNDTLELKGGWSRALVGPAGIPWVKDRLCLHNTIFGLSLEDGDFQQYIVEPLSWASEQGAPIWMYLQDHDKYQARLVEDYTVGIGVRNRCGMRILDVLEA